MASLPASNDAEISAETSQRVCTHMNEDHAVSVYAMAKSLLAQDPSVTANDSLTDATLTRVSLSACHMRAILCSGNVCEMKQLIYPLEPPLTSASELRPRMVAVHHKVTRPKVTWLWTKPLCRVILPVSIVLLYATFVICIGNLVSLIESKDIVHQLVSMTFGSARNFGNVVAFSAWFVVVVHSAEALYVFYHAVKTLKFHQDSALLWYAMVTMSGYPITAEFLDLLKFHRKTQAAKKKS
ncbi:hypothetical protein MPSEU_000285900 [Mayamaea pseudoterrestris]|nr:hypothetical protein MPSEU_000285900 [Mayamaea pseudoterrestris]